MSTPKKLLTLIAISAATAGAFVFSGVAQQKKGETNALGVTNAALTPISAQAVAFAESEALRDLPDATEEEMAAFEPRDINEDNVIPFKRVNAAAMSSRWPAVDSALPGPKAAVAPAAPVGTPLANFDGMADADGDVTLGGRVAPSDQNVAVGPKHVVQSTNVGFRVWDKSGNPLTNPKLISKLFARIGGVCASTERGDPIVIHDRMADRWLLSQFDFANGNAAPFYECIAISKTGDPTGSYYLYAFQTPTEQPPGTPGAGTGQNFPDYPHLGTWPDGYYMTVNQFDRSNPPGFQFNGTGCYAFNRAKMLVGDPTASFIYFNLNLATHNEGIASMQPSDFDGFILPPGGAPNVFVYEISDELEAPPYNVDALRMFNFHADFATPGNATFTERAESPLAVAAYDARSPEYITGSRAEANQPPPAATPAGTPPANQGDALNVINYHVMYRLQYRRLYNQATLASTSENLTLSSTVNVSGVTPDTANTYQAGVRYYQLRKTASAAPYSVFDQATFNPQAGTPGTGNNRFLPSAAIDIQNNLAVSYSLSSRATFPSIYYAGRDFGTTGALSGEQLLFAGTASQIGSGNRWGDYQSLQVDPTDDCTFWTNNQYYNDQTVVFQSGNPPVPGSFNWRTRIGSFKFPTCTAPSQGTLTGTITSCETGAPISGAIVQLSNGFSGATGPDGKYSIQLPASSAVATGVSFNATVIAPARKCNPAGPFLVTILNNEPTTLDACLNGTPLMQLDPTDANAVQINGPNGSTVYPNSCITTNVRLQNNGCATTKNMTATLSSNTPGVHITNPTVTYPNTPIDGQSFNSVPFQLYVDPTVQCGTSISLTVTPDANGGASPSTFTIPVACGNAPNQTLNGQLDPTDLKTTNGRISRNGVPSDCSGKSCPGALGAGPRDYDSYTFTNGPGNACVTVTLLSPSSAPAIQAGAYLTANGFNPASATFCENYLGDNGTSPWNAGQSFSFTVPANAAWQLVVIDTGGATATQAYSIQVSGMSAPPPAGNGPCPTGGAGGMTTQAQPNAATVGDSISDMATLTGTSPTGTITFKLFNNATCSGTALLTSVKNVSGSGNYVSDSYPNAQAGT